MTTPTGRRRILPNYRRAFRQTRQREQVLSDTYQRQQHSYRELEAHTSEMTKRATEAEQQLKMIQAKLKAAQEQRDTWQARYDRLLAITAALRRATGRYLDLARRIPAGDLDPLDVCYVVTEYQHQMLVNALMGQSPLPTVVCLCGSTRFYAAFQRLNYEETMAGRIVLSVGFYPHSQEQAHGEDVGCTTEQKYTLDELHKRKIDLADEILVLNCGDYVGPSTRGEIAYAKQQGKHIRWLFPHEEVPNDNRATSPV